ncbi:MAG TPA: alpha/beta fold hydrolase [Planctomycetota bacterium]|nr:alpha/beta fold hydrolase [Planctomycetota bacterium]
MTAVARAPQGLYPFEGRFFDRGDGIRMHYVDEGPRDAAPVVMVHGNPSWSFYFRDLIRALAPRRRVIAPDHVGCGRSDKPGEDRYAYRLASRVDDLERLLDHLGARERVTLVLHDWGGMIGMAWAVRHPERVERLVILNTAAFPLPASKPLPWSLWLGRNTALGAFLVRGLNAFSRGAVRWCVTRAPMAPEVAAGYLEPYDSWAHRLAVLRFVQDIPLRPGDPSWGPVSEVAAKLGRFAKTPMLICWGERDFVFDRHFLDEWTRRFPAAEVHRFPDAGHYVLEDAGREIVPLVEKFVP